MRKYGIEHFHIELIETSNNTSEREQYWIEKLGSYSNGYNATKGGDGKKYIDYEPIAKRLLENPNTKLVAQEFGCSCRTVRNIAKQFGITVQHKYIPSTIILQLDPKTEDIINIFDSVSDVEQCLHINKHSASHIYDVCNGKRNTALGYKWKCIDRESS